MKIHLIGLLIVTLVLASFGVGHGQTVTYEAITVAATAIGLAGGTLITGDGNRVSRCSGRLDTAQIRQRWDGTDPTATEGELVEIGDVITLSGYAVIEDVRWIRTGSTSGILRLHCWR